MLNKFKNTKAYLNNYSKELVKLLRIEVGRNRTRSYASGTYNSPIDATGRLKQSIEAISKDSSKSIKFNIMANDYAVSVDEGRGQGKYPPIEDIIDWIQAKPIRIRDAKGRFKTSSDYEVRKLAHNISRKIARKGIKPTNFITDAINKSMDKMNKIGAAVGKDVSLNLDDILVKAGYVKKGENYIIKKNE